VLHLLFQIAQDGFAIAIEELDQAADVFVVRIAGNLVGARRGALVDRVKQAGAEEFLARIGFANLQVAGAELERLLKVLSPLP
jgi:hypothetical protein